jgi:hypothetical protein
LSEGVRRLLENNPRGEELKALNLCLLEEAYPHVFMDSDRVYEKYRGFTEQFDREWEEVYAKAVGGLKKVSGDKKAWADRCLFHFRFSHDAIKKDLVLDTRSIESRIEETHHRPSDCCSSKFVWCQQHPYG